MTEPDNTSAEAYREALHASRRFSLPFSRQSWQGRQGGWKGNDTGSSIDFQDHRDYQWGDDPRAIHWAAYARTGQLTMKLYRAEVSPIVEIVLDASPSMFMTETKAIRTESLLLFCLESALGNGSPVRFHAVCGNRIIPLEIDAVRSGSWKELIHGLGADETMPVIPVWKGDGMKVLISDLLYPGDPITLLGAMNAGGGTSVILAPALAEEAAFNHIGNIRLKNCETGQTRIQRITPSLAAKYERAYERHFSLWRETCRRFSASMARIPAEGSLSNALCGDALRQETVEMR
ncbi:DUF58 domain-containing protein [Akkermansia sp. N21116]|uniref:DUF58 domain-containing protein n=1 Tax=Akkermansia sp. N21116 TaxID=3040764 RepID=UPI00244EDEF1|nr:DUF58 domain-containing protein [Akkermansia sp. N21116]WPX40261.1 DUF58 domain-containing protein [Akkermansia sp. N21116]